MVLREADLEILRELGLTHTVRESKKARRIILKVLAGPRLEVVIPAGLDHRRVPEILARKKDWLAQAVKGMGNAGAAKKEGWTLPREIPLRAIHRRVLVAGEMKRTGMVHLEEQGESKIFISGEIQHEQLGRSILHQWMRHQAELHLPPWLQRVSRETGLGFQKVQVRRQKTRWGSCSARGTISLNEKLLFLPPHLVRYIMIHELCHLTHLNHSSRFWNLVSRFEPQWRELDRSITQAGGLVPSWAH